MLAKLGVIEIDFASTHSTMPPSSVVGFGFVAIGLAKLGKKLLCQSKWLYPHQAKLTNRSTGIGKLCLIVIIWACGVGFNPMAVC